MLKNSNLLSIWIEIEERLRIFFTTEKAIHLYFKLIVILDKYMSENSIIEYAPSVGVDFINYVSRTFCKVYLDMSKALVKKINKCHPAFFWLEDYHVGNYKIVCKSLENMFGQLKTVLQTIQRDSTTIDFAFRCVCRLDVFMRLNKIDDYDPSVGDSYLQYIKQNTNYDEENFARFYSNHINRINSYYYGNTPYEILPSNYVVRNVELSKCLSMLLDTMAKQKVSSGRIRAAELVVRHLDVYMSDNNIENYTADVGEAFITYCKKHLPNARNYVYTTPIINHLNDIIAERSFSSHHKRNNVVIPCDFLASYKTYICECIEKGDKDNTLKRKKNSCIAFFRELQKKGIHKIESVTYNLFIDVLANITPSYWSGVKGYMISCSRNNYIETNYGFIIPHKKTILQIPPYYTKEERLLLEAVPDRSTSVGKRDYAIILLADRLGLRTSDIINLSFSNLDHRRKIIDFVQTKTNRHHSLPLHKEVEDALIDYIENGRPDSDSDLIFLRSIAPFNPISRAGVYCMISKSLRLAGIDVKNRKHGAHALRASLSTDMVNNGMNYTVASDVLGQKDRNVIQHYARLDINHLRLCALKPLPPSGNFMAVLSNT